MVLRRIVFALLAIAGTVSCGNGPNPDTEVVDAGGVSVLMLTENFERGGAGVGIFGSLRLVGHQCVGFVMGHEKALLVFPPDTSVTGSGPDVVIHVQGADLRLGDRFSGGSLFGGPESLSIFGGLRDKVPSSCSGLRAVAFEPDHA